MYFPDKNQKPLRMCRMQIAKQAVAIFSLISGNEDNKENFFAYMYVIFLQVTSQKRAKSSWQVLTQIVLE